MPERPQESLPPHMQYDYVRGLASKEPKPALLARYLLDLVNNDEALESAVSTMTRIPVGFNALYVSKKPLLQINFYRADITGNEDPHGHGRWARTAWYAPLGSTQTIVRHQPLSPDVKRLKGLPVQERRVMPNTLMETSGGRPLYDLVPLRSTLVLPTSITRKAPLSGEDFQPWEVHNVKVNQNDNRVAMSTHVKGRKEPRSLSTREGLIDYKRMHPDDADELLARRVGLAARIAAGEFPEVTGIGPTTMIYVPLDRDIATMEPIPTPTSPELAEELIFGGLQTALELAA